jgi:amino acid transporter
MDSDAERILREHRDRGLVQVVGPLGLAANVVNIVIGAGIFVLPAAIAGEIGSAAPLAYGACAIAMGAIALCFAEAGSRVPTSGGPYGYAEAAFGPFAGFIMGALVWLAAVLASAGIAAALVEVLAGFAPVLGGPAARAGIILALYAVLAAVNIAGAAPGARLVGVTTVAKLIPLLVFLAVGAFLVRPENLTIASVPATSDFGRAMFLAIFAFSGMETALAVSGEVRAPARSVPIGLLGAMGGVTAIYILIQIVAQGVLGSDLARSTTPLSDALVDFSPGLANLLLAGAAISMSGYLAGNALSAPRLLFAAARDGFLPSGLAAIHPRTHAPAAAIIVHLGIAAALALSGTFIELAVLSTLATVGIYVLGCAASLALRRRDVATVGKPLRFRATVPAAFIGIASMLWVAAQATAGEAISVALALALIGALYLGVRYRRTRTGSAD